MYTCMYIYIYIHIHILSLDCHKLYKHFIIFNCFT
uniref:Uncharacterized protein n=1 Tax=Anguilla anguilla TaxID=7936 RepID=A0A0E9UMX4_ANGAN